MKKKTRKKNKSPTLSNIQEFCPWVESVIDADVPIVILVTQKDVNSAEVKSHLTCALAIACRRWFHADAALVSKTVAYVVKGLRAVRYKLGPSIQQEIVVFDRKGPFKAGEYQLSPPSPSNRLGLVRAYDPVRKSKNGGKSKRFVHYTEDVRTALSRLPAEKMMKTEIEKMRTRLKGNHKK
jgi:hypothetical protein